jgi:hypothetical protein
VSISSVKLKNLNFESLKVRLKVWVIVCEATLCFPNFQLFEQNKTQFETYFLKNNVKRMYWNDCWNAMSKTTVKNWKYGLVEGMGLCISWLGSSYKQTILKPCWYVWVSGCGTTLRFPNFQLFERNKTQFETYFLKNILI